MSIFSKQVSEITFNDIEELSLDEAQENIRLEFKRESPDKDEWVKKISSFANTFGGHIVIGAGEDGSGIISDIEGVDKVSGLKQRIIQYCYDAVYPPIDVYVSEPIEHRTKTGKYFYVIYVPESDRSPHFINRRKGCYIRTDEFSQRFEPRLADFNEIEHLADRRSKSLEFRDHLISRSENRFAKHIGLNYQSSPGTVGEIDSTLSVAIVPKYPLSLPLEVYDLQNLLNTIKYGARDEIFPIGRHMSLNEGFYYEAPRGLGLGFSYLEINIHRLIYFALEVGRAIGENTVGRPPEEIIIYANEVIAWIIFYLVFAQRFYERVGYMGIITMQIKLERFLERFFFIRGISPLDIAEATLGSAYDDLILLEFEYDTDTMFQEKRQIVRNIYRKIAFACGWVNAYSTEDQNIDYLIGKSLDYLFWKNDKLDE